MTISVQPSYSQTALSSPVQAGDDLDVAQTKMPNGSMGYKIDDVINALEGRREVLKKEKDSSAAPHKTAELEKEIEKIDSRIEELGSLRKAGAEFVPTKRY